MSDHPLVIPISTGGVFRPEDTCPTRGGNSRMVKMVPVGDGNRLPCLIRSREAYTIDSDDLPLSAPSYECLLLVSRKPYLVMRAYVEVAAWPTLSEQPLEW